MSVGAGLRRAAEAVSSAMFVAVFLIFNYKIASRYLWRDEPAWADEVSVILFIWIVFWASALRDARTESRSCSTWRTGRCRHGGSGWRRWGGTR